MVAEIPVSYFLVQLEGLGIGTTKILYLVVWQFFITLDMEAVLYMLYLRLTNTSFLGEVFKLWVK